LFTERSRATKLEIVREIEKINEIKEKSRNFAKFFKIKLFSFNEV